MLSTAGVERSNRQNDLVRGLLQKVGVSRRELVLPAAEKRDHANPFSTQDERSCAIGMKSLCQGALFDRELAFCFHIATDDLNAMFEHPAVVTILAAEQHSQAKVAVGEFTLPCNQLQSIMLRLVNS